MEKICDSLEKIFNEELKKGNTPLKIVPDYSPTLKQAFFMKNPMSKSTFEKYSKIKHYGYWRYKGSPQNPADEGFIDKEAMEAIVFPIKAD